MHQHQRIDADAAMNQAASTVLPKAVVAESTPVSWASMASAALC